MADTDERVGFSRTRNDQVARARAVAQLLDKAVRIPGTSIRFGLDAVLGLIPGVGDAAGAVFSGYLILLGSRLGMPKDAIVRMIANVAIDTIVGGIPVLGDLFDVAWKANTKNLQILEQYTGNAALRTATREPDRVGKGVIVGALLVLLLLVAGGIWLTIVAIKGLIGLLT